MHRSNRGWEKLHLVVVAAISAVISSAIWFGISEATARDTTVQQTLGDVLPMAGYRTTIATWNLCNHACEVNYHGLAAMGTVKDRVHRYRDVIRESGATLVALQEADYKDAQEVTTALGRHWSHSVTGKSVGGTAMNQETVWDERVWSNRALSGATLRSGRFKNTTDQEAWDPAWVNPDGTRGQLLKKRWTGFQLLRLIPTGQVFAVVNVHTYWCDYLITGAPHPLDTYRATQVRHVAEFIRQQFGGKIPVLVLGDLNTHLGLAGDNPLTTLAALGLDNVWDEGRNESPNEGTTRMTEHPAGWGTGAPIDHIFVPKNTAVDTVQIVRSVRASDHNLVRAKVMFVPAATF